jgi:hypothetical protein
MNEKHKSTTPSAKQVKNQQDSSTEEKLDIISQPEKGEQIVSI